VTVEQLVPEVRAIDAGAVVQRVRGAARRHPAPFDPARVDFSDAVSRAIFGHPRARAFPETIALAFWLRRSAVMQLAERFTGLEAACAIRVPRGLVFHLPPTNVDTLFVYSLMVSFLVGNLNVVRVSSGRRPEPVGLLCEVLRDVAAETGFADELAVVSYGHEPEPTAAFSRAADVRVVWGGDESVARIRAVPLGPGAHELTFGDRFSFAVARPRAVLDDLPGVAERLFNDAYWFDQMGCSSPRLLVWVGSGAEVDAARRALYAALADVVEARGYGLEPGAAIAKLTFAYGALIDRPVTRLEQAGNGLSVLELADLEGFDRSHPGAGLFFEARVDALADLAPFVTRKDQTMTAHGFSAEELTTFARSLHGRGIDRIVAFGEALSFGSLWDGYDLLAELTRVVTVSDGSSPNASAISS
jgi:hypothetical protein